MNNKNGFTLVEIVMVIGLIAVISLLVVPKIVESFDKSKKNMFYDEVLSLYSQATNDYINNLDEDIDALKEFDETNNPLNIKVSEDLDYYVKVDEDGNVIKIEATNKEYYYVYENSKIKKSDIKRSDIDDYGGETISIVTPPPRYVYWSHNESGDVKLTPNQMPDTVYNSYTRIAHTNGKPYVFVRTKLVDNSPVEHEPCLNYNNKIFCFDKDYLLWNSGSLVDKMDENKAKLKADLDSFFGIEPLDFYSCADTGSPTTFCVHAYYSVDGSNKVSGSIGFNLYMYDLYITSSYNGISGPSVDLTVDPNNGISGDGNIEVLHGV